VRTLKTLLAAIAACSRIFVVGYFRGQCAAADAVDRRRLSKPSCPARLLLFRYAVNK